MSGQAVPYLDLKPQYRAMEAAINARIKTVLEHGQFILGPEVEESEKALAAFAGSKYCLTAASGTDALVMALMAYGIGPGDEVITTGFSFFATAEVISLVGATPRSLVSAILLSFVGAIRLSLVGAIPLPRVGAIFLTLAGASTAAVRGAAVQAVTNRPTRNANVPTKNAARTDEYRPRTDHRRNDRTDIRRTSLVY